MLVHRCLVLKLCCNKLFCSESNSTDLLCFLTLQAPTLCATMRYFITDQPGISGINSTGLVASGLVVSIYL